MNNDRFKFRVWNKKQGNYLCEEYQSAVLNGDGSLSILDFTDGEISEMSDDAYYGDGNCIVEQCTGCKDKNGKLIYEGDIVVTACFSDKPERMVVCFRRHRFTFEFEIDAGSLAAEYWGVNDDTACCCVVVGNTHDKEKNEQKENVQ